MSITSKAYEEMIRKYPGLKPIEERKPTSPNTHKKLQEDIREIWSPTSNTKERSVIRPPALKFTIPGQPVGKPRMTVRDKWFKRPCVVKYWAWAEVARNSVPQRTILGIYREISFVAYLEIPKSYSKAKRTLLTGQPHLGLIDGDNILKALQDSLFKQDKYIWKFSGEKRWDDGLGARIEVELR